MDLSKLTIDQLKVLAYDQIVLLEQTQNNLKIINQELLNRQKEDGTTKDKAK